MQSIEEFAEQHRLKTKRDGCGDTIILGKVGHIGDGYAEGFGVCVMHATRKRWGNARRKMEAAGFAIRQDADTEGVALFKPANNAQTKLALKLSGIKARRRMAAPSTAQLAARAAFGQSRRLIEAQPEQESA